MCEYHGSSEMTIKTDVPCHSKCGTLKKPSLLNSRTCRAHVKFFSSSPVRVTSLYEWSSGTKNTKQTNTHKKTTLLKLSIALIQYWFPLSSHYIWFTWNWQSISWEESQYFPLEYRIFGLTWTNLAQTGTIHLSFKLKWTKFVASSRWILKVRILYLCKI